MGDDRGASEKGPFIPFLDWQREQFARRLDALVMVVGWCAIQCTGGLMLVPRMKLLASKTQVTSMLGIAASLGVRGCAKTRVCVKCAKENRGLRYLPTTVFFTRRVVNWQKRRAAEAEVSKHFSSVAVSSMATR